MMKNFIVIFFVLFFCAVSAFAQGMDGTPVVFSDGPAYISYNYDGTINCKLYYINGIRYDDEFKFLIAAQVYKNSNNIEE